MPAPPAEQRTSYRYDHKRDAVLLTIDGAPPIKVHLSENMLKNAAKELKEGRKTDKQPVALSSE